MNQTVCFEYCDQGYSGACRDHRTVQVVNCSDFMLWYLPPAPDCACVYCTAPSVIPAPAPPQPWSGPALTLQHTTPGGFPALDLEKEVADGRDDALFYPSFLSYFVTKHDQFT